MYSKQSQLTKAKKDNPKKMSKSEYKKKCDWLFDKYPRCQICLCTKATEAHHSRYGRMGADKDDTSIIAICRDCHHEIHHGKGLIMAREDIEVIGYNNHREWVNASN